MTYINFHTHLYPDDPEQITAIISCMAPEPLPECPKNTWFSYGIHPWYLQGHDISALPEKVKKRPLTPACWQ